MKKLITFKTLIDILFILHCTGFFAALFIFPLNPYDFDKSEYYISNWSLLHWAIVIVGVLGYILLLIGLFQLKKTAGYILRRKQFTNEAINNLKKSGKNFVYTSIIITSIHLLRITLVNTHEKLLFIGDFNSFFSILLLMIVGLFFIIQSEILLSAKNYKEENDLTI